MEIYEKSTPISPKCMLTESIVLGYADAVRGLTKGNFCADDIELTFCGGNRRRQGKLLAAVGDCDQRRALLAAGKG